jgi:mono/diheme cytochrome c family protein
MPPIALALLALLPGVDYLTEVKPLMATRCVACHGALQQKGGLRLDTVARMRIGGDSGPAIVAGKPSESPLWQRVAGHGAGRRMPPKGEGEDVNPTEQMRLSEWIAAGAPAPSKETEDPDPRDHWAFRKPKRATPPEVIDSILWHLRIALWLG